MAESFTPLRYPGGKSKLFSFVVGILKANSLEGSEYCEPYAGGAGLAIELLVKGYASKIHINDKSLPVYLFWKSIVDQPELFIQKMWDTPVSVNEWRKQKMIMANPDSNTKLDVGFSFFYLNRTNRSGILTGGPIGGFDQSGNYKIDARFNKTGLIKKISRIASFGHAINVYNCDAIDFISTHVKMMPKRTFVYLDPPYFEQGKRLYLNYYNKADHAKVANAIQSKIKQPWIVTYDLCPEIIDLYRSNEQRIIALNYSATNHKKSAELLVSSNKLKLPEHVILDRVSADFQRSLTGC